MASGRRLDEYGDLWTIDGCATTTSGSPSEAMLRALVVAFLSISKKISRPRVY